MPQTCKIDVSLNLDYLENKTGVIVFNVYLISMSETVSSCSLKENSALLFVSGYISAILWG